ncbi:MAG: hypothetical protein KF866_03785 [Phycisphaeraceae bacterium]|nr:hypothetical protein [Phycisphaeraceae bacterium]MCW5753185.1 hypothetical protein [Phycisphaeraceae bacterium]
MQANRRKRVFRATSLMLLAGGALSLLIWGKLRLVTDVPRSAYAEPTPEGRPAVEIEPVPAGPDEPQHRGQRKDASVDAGPWRGD